MAENYRAPDPFFTGQVSESNCVHEAFDPHHITCDPFYMEGYREALPVHAVVFRVVNNDGELVPSVIMSVTALDEPVLGGVAKDGTFATRLKSGRYVIHATKDNNLKASETVQVEQSDVLQVFTIRLNEARLSLQDSLTFNGSRGIYEAVVDMGLVTGEIHFVFNAWGVPDRFIIDYDGDVAADSLFIGDRLSYMADGVKGSHTLNTYVLGADRRFKEVGSKTVTYSADDIASLDPAHKRASGGHFLQKGVVENYPTAGDAAYAGLIKLRLFKAKAYPTTATVRIIGVEGNTVWALSSIDLVT